MELLVHETLRANATKYPEKTVVVDGKRRMTYSQFNERVNRLANALTELGVSRGDKVGILMFNCIEYLEAFFGISKAGAVSVPINYRSVARELEYFVNNSDTSLLVVGEEFVELLRSILPNCEQLQEERCIVVGAERSDRMLAYEEILKGASPREPEMPISFHHLLHFGYHRAAQRSCHLASEQSTSLFLLRSGIWCL
jgi:acyl-CoA synthetase (AMP-forming)/AMP-acid ligase II